MSDLAPETPRPQGLEATLKKKVIGPVPLWLLIGVGGGVLLLLLRHGKSGGGSTPDPTSDGSSGAVDAASGDPGATAGGVGSLDQGPTGNLGGFEDPGMISYPDFQYPDNNPGVSPNPPASDPVYHPLLSAGIRQAIIARDYPAAYASLYGGTSHPIGIVANPITVSPDTPQTQPLGTTAIVHPLLSPAGRIAAITSVQRTTPGGISFVHASSAATGRAV